MDNTTIILNVGTAYYRTGLLAIQETPHDLECDKCGAKDVDLLIADTSTEGDFESGEYGIIAICFDCLSKAITLHTMSKLSK